MGAGPLLRQSDFRRAPSGPAAPRVQRLTSCSPEPVRFMPDERPAPSSLATFSATVAGYLSSVLPGVTRELAHWRRRALQIPDPTLRALACEANAKRGNMEGAALFAVLAPRRRRTQTLRALVAFQTAYNYLDTLAEQPSADPLQNGRRLHEALLVSLDPSAAHADYYAFHPQREDGGYLTELSDTCRQALATLPAHVLVSSATWAAAARIVAFQSLNLTEHQGGYEELQRWARELTPVGSALAWWQAAGAGGSSLAVHALIAAAADPELRQVDVQAIHDAYFPWICALHSLLDSLVDLDEDDRAAQRNLLAYDASDQHAARAMGSLARRARAATAPLPQAARHRVIVCVMAAYYLSSPQAATPRAQTIAAGIPAALSPLLAPALMLFRLRRLAARLTHGAYN